MQLIISPRRALRALSLLVAGALPARVAAQVPRLEVPVLPVPVVVDGMPRIVYELRVTNPGTTPVTLRRVIARDALSGRPLFDVGGDSLRSHVAAVPASTGGDARTIAAGGRALVYIEADLPGGAAHPGRPVDYEVAYERDAGEVTLRAGPWPIAATEPPQLGPPVAGGPWVAVYAAAWPRGHRRVVYEVDGRARIPGRFAIDWIFVDEEGRTARGDPDIVANWLGYGAPVLAVADAVVAAARDDVSESPRISTHFDHPLEDATGNYIALDLGDGRFAFYEHLKPGSVRVAPGDSVRRGQRIAELGFTGHSTGPHLHFHVADANSPLGAEGVPFVIDCFDVRGWYDDIAALGTAPWRPRAPGLLMRRRMERPAPNAVVEFGCPVARTSASNTP